MSPRNAKKRWKRPELIVLVRTTPEEAILMGCKGDGTKPGPRHAECFPETGPCEVTTGT